MYRLTRLSLSSPRITLLAVALASLAFAGGLPRLRTEFGYRVLVGDEHPAIRTLDAFIARYAGGLPVHVVWECGNGSPCESVFDAASLEMADAVTRAIAPAAGVQKVYGVANAALLVPGEGGFAVRRFVRDGVVAADAERLARRALDDPLWIGNLVSADARVAVLTVQPSDSENETSEAVLAAVEEALAPHEARGFVFHLLGDPVSTVVSGRLLAESTAALIPFTVLAIALILFALSGSWRDVAVALVTMGVALVWTFGALGWLGWPQDGILEVLAPLILIVGVCDAMHLLSRQAAEASQAVPGDAADAALLRAARDVGAPCLVTTLTTAAAFLSFLTSDLEAFTRFGAISAFGVTACLLLTFTLLPVLVHALPPSPARAARGAARWEAALGALSRAAERHTVPILLGAVASLGVFAVGWIAYLRVDTNWLESFGAHNPVIRSIRFVEERLRPSGTLEVEVALPEGVALEAPDTLHRVDRFAEFLSGLERHGKASSVVDLVSRLNRLLHGDDPAFEAPGASTGANAELLELIGMDDPTLLASWISLDRSRLRIAVETPQDSIARRERVLEQAKHYAASALPAAWDVSFTGEGGIAVDWVRDVQGTQLRSFPTAFALVLLLVAVFLRSVPLGLAAMIPALLPVVVTLGAMGWLGMTLDIGRTMVAAVILGIAVDDSIHLLSRYRAQRAAGDAPRDAVHAAVLHAGRAVVTTSLALALGFLTLTASAWATISSFGAAVALAILVALAASLLVLPAVLFTCASRRGEPQRTTLRRDGPKGAPEADAGGRGRSLG